MIKIKQQHVSNQRNTMAGQENLWSQQRISCIHEHLLLTQEIVKNTDMVNNSPQMHMTLTAFCEGDNS